MADFTRKRKRSLDEDYDEELSEVEEESDEVDFEDEKDDLPPLLSPPPGPSRSLDIKEDVDSS
jgi:hypothetical protein